ncbi:MAG: response regulator [Proteobacteria bacterium]|nr:MAG: response regulator [Pseudomonadota bacterium]
MPRILILDDEPLICMMMQDWLGELACEAVGPVHAAGLALVLVKETPVDCALIDLSLKDGPSYAVASALRERGIPFAFVTGHGEHLLDPAFKEVVVLRKPIEFERFKDVVGQLVAMRQRHLVPPSSPGANVAV